MNCKPAGFPLKRGPKKTKSQTSSNFLRQSDLPGSSLSSWLLLALVDARGATGPKGTQEIPGDPKTEQNRPKQTNTDQDPKRFQESPKQTKTPQNSLSWFPLDSPGLLSEHLLPSPGAPDIGQGPHGGMQTGSCEVGPLSEAPGGKNLFCGARTRSKKTKEQPGELGGARRSQGGQESQRMPGNQGSQGLQRVLLLSPGSFWFLLGPPGSFWLLLALSLWLSLSGSSWLPLVPPGSSWLFLAPKPETKN